MRLDTRRMTSSACLRASRFSPVTRGERVLGLKAANCFARNAFTAAVICCTSSAEARSALGVTGSLSSLMFWTLRERSRCALLRAEVYRTRAQLPFKRGDIALIGNISGKLHPNPQFSRRAARPRGALLGPRRHQPTGSSSPACTPKRPSSADCAARFSRPRSRA